MVIGRVRAFFPIVLRYEGIPRCAVDLGDAFSSDRLEFELIAFMSGVEPRRYVRTPLPSLAVRAAFRLRREPELKALLGTYLAATTRPGDIAYLWPGTPVGVYETMARLGVPIVTEMVNCEESFRVRILREAHARLGIPHDLAEHAPTLRDEPIKFDSSSRIFVPSRMVEESLLQAGVPSQRLVRTSYAWEPRTFVVPRDRPPRRDGPPVFLSVAHGSVRKGTLELLHAWQRKRAPARLVLVGDVHPALEAKVAALSQRDDVVRMGYVGDLAPLYAAADVFILLSHEEGSPIVSYLALGAGLPIIGSPAATDGLVTSEENGLVVPPADADAVANAIDRLACDEALRLRMGAVSRKRSEDFTWERVTARRVRAFEDLAAASRPGSPSSPFRALFSSLFDRSASPGGVTATRRRSR